jgi:hypothetical protein
MCASAAAPHAFIHSFMLHLWQKLIQATPTHSRRRQLPKLTTLCRSVTWFHYPAFCTTSVSAPQQSTQQQQPYKGSQGSNISDSPVSDGGPDSGSDVGPDIGLDGSPDCGPDDFFDDFFDVFLDGISDCRPDDGPYDGLSAGR